jgi:hypothetical protein
MRAPLPYTSSARRHAARILAKLSVAAALTGCVAAVLLSGTVSAFNAVTSNPSNAMSAGTVVISDNDGGTAQVAPPDRKPGDTLASCMTVTYDGTVPATVAMHGTPGGTLGAYVDLKVTRGTISGTPAPYSCVNFTGDATNYLGKGAGVIYDGTLAGWPASSGTAIADPPSGALETWTQGESHAYLIQMTLQNTLAAQGRTATQTFKWQAANK